MSRGKATSSAAIDKHLLGEAIRSALSLFLCGEPSLSDMEIEVALHTEVDGSFGLSIDGAIFEVELRAINRQAERAA